MQRPKRARWRRRVSRAASDRASASGVKYSAAGSTPVPAPCVRASRAVAPCSFSGAATREPCGEHKM